VSAFRLEPDIVEGNKDWRVLFAFISPADQSSVATRIVKHAKFMSLTTPVLLFTISM
jgi:hypothetical protein